MLNWSYYLQSLKWIAPGLFMLGTAPTYYILWGGWRGLTLLLPTRIYEVGDDFLYSLYQRFLLFFFENCSGVEIILSGDVDRVLAKKENVILMMNHQCTVDWMVADFLGVRQGSIGNIRYILKEELKWVPLYGFYFRQHSCIYVKRSGQFKQDKAIRQLDMVTENKTPFWMVVFPEGTRYNPNKPKVIEQSRQFAEKAGLPPFEQLLMPRHKGMKLCLDRLRKSTAAIYDITAAYTDTLDKATNKRKCAPDLADFLVGRSRQLHIHVKRIDINDVPDDEEEFKSWLRERFQVKDKLLQRFYSRDPAKAETLVDGGKESVLSLRHTLPALLLFTALNVPLWGLAAGRQIYWKMSVFGMVTGWFWMAIKS